MESARVDDDVARRWVWEVCAVGCAIWGFSRFWNPSFARGLIYIQKEPHVVKHAARVRTNKT